ncbi:MAG: molecular chaperone DnaJ, partial [Bacteroidales bacterium]|nr:molecular chaperone DnaJ [Bacteroidales bacterium]
LKIAPGTQPNTQIRLAGMGLPSVNGYGKGDMIVNIGVYVPEKLDDEEKKLITELKEHKNIRPTESLFDKFRQKVRSMFS